MSLSGVFDFGWQVALPIGFIFRKPENYNIFALSHAAQWSVDRLCAGLISGKFQPGIKGANGSQSFYIQPNRLKFIVVFGLVHQGNFII
jgi:hypothetical protein